MNSQISVAGMVRNSHVSRIQKSQHMNTFFLTEVTADLSVKKFPKFPRTQPNCAV